ncbi:GNAT family N-acetyltransferase [Embleya sp. NPDC020630]|uniref:GNAT family N-acetyltransferase n=1 Tax=Embleya sp. NPDC020630 TaxID=3363979 RepID=UPI00378DC032
MTAATSPVISLGFRTDLMLLTLQGSRVEERDGYRVVRTPANPTFHWGNFLLLPAPPAPGAAARWVDTFRRDFPDADHVALGVDGTDGTAGDPADLAAAELHVERGTVLTAASLRPPARPNTTATYRVADSDDDWAQALALNEAGNTDFEPTAYREFAARRLAGFRALQERGHGAWFGAFEDGRLRAGLGLFTDGRGLARYQTVGTHPDHRNRGLASGLVHAAAEHAAAHWSVTTLVIVADPDYVAIDLYRRLGFAGTETQIQLQIVPT